MHVELKNKEAIFPMPVLIIATYNDDGTVNAMNAAWGTMVDAGKVALNLTATHKSVANIKKRGAFTVSIADLFHIKEADYFGVTSGNQVKDKLAATKLTFTPSEAVDAPIINEFPITFECRFIEYQDGPYGLGVIGEVVRVSALERLVNDGKIDMEAVHAIAFDPYTHGYYEVGRRVGEAFHDGLELKR